MRTSPFDDKKLDSVTSTLPPRTRVKLNLKKKKIYLEASDFRNNQDLQAQYPRKNAEALRQASIPPALCPWHLQIRKAERLRNQGGNGS